MSTQVLISGLGLSMPNYSGTPGPVRLQRFGVWLAILFRTVTTNHTGQADVVTNDTSVSDCAKRPRVPLERKIYCVWLYSGTPSYTQKLPEDVKSGSENLLFGLQRREETTAPSFVTPSATAAEPGALTPSATAAEPGAGPLFP